MTNYNRFKEEYTYEYRNGEEEYYFNNYSKKFYKHGMNY